MNTALDLLFNFLTKILEKDKTHQLTASNCKLKVGLQVNSFKLGYCRERGYT